MSEASLTLVGSGIKFYSHLTHETKAYILQSDLVLYLVNDPVMKAWIKKNSRRSESLDGLYVQHNERIDCYRAITNYILQCLRMRQHICIIFYGHPCVYSKPGLDAIIQASQEGFDTCILPGISAEDCLFADLKIDPSTYGCQSFEASDFLIYQRQLDPTCHVIFWQIDAIGILDHSSAVKNKIGLGLFIQQLSKHYSLQHQVIIYEASQYPGFKPKITSVLLNDLINCVLSRISTLYIPPAYQASPNKDILKKLNINLKEQKIS